MIQSVKILEMIGETMRKKILSILLAACLIFSLLPVSAMADAAESGSCGDNLTWTLENGVLTISGTGRMGYYYPTNDNTTAPWGGILQFN